MRVLVALISLGLAGCGHGSDSSGTGSAAPKAAAVTCPPGSAAKDGGCVVVVTPEKITAIAAQQSRIDELGALLDKVATVTAPIELLDGIRQLDQWKQLTAASPKLKVVDTVVATLNDAVAQLRTFRASLAETSKRLGDLKGELDRLLAEHGVAHDLDDLRAKISAQLRQLVEPFGAQVAATIQRALTPLSTQLADMQDLVLGACAMAKLSGGSDQLATMCGQARTVFSAATVYLDDLKAKPAKLFDDVVTLLIAQLDQLVDVETKRALGVAQTTVDDALRIPSSTGSGH